MALTVPAGSPTKTTVYTELRGVDFSQDASLVDRQHSPDMLNMISDEGGSPVKRKGWEVLATKNNCEINNLWRFTQDGEEYFACCYSNPGANKTALAFFDPDTGLFEQTVELTGGTVIAADAFYAGDRLYVFCKYGVKTAYYTFRVASGTKEISPVIPKTPTIIINRNPASGGGTAYEDLNLLTNTRTELFKDTSSSTSFLLTATEQPYDIQLWYLDATGTWIADGTVDFTAENRRYRATITAGHEYPSGHTGDNIKITYACGSQEHKVVNCTNHAFFSHGGLDQVFVTGNSFYPNYIWYSDYGDPTYFPDLNYIVAGSSDTMCMGFLNVGETLAVVKETSGQGSSIFFIYETSVTSTTVTTDNKSETTQEYAYALKRATSGVGAISKRCFSILQDEPLFLSADGVQGIISTNVTAEKIVRNRSRRVDKKLLKESNLDRAFSCVHNGYYYVFINGHVYVFDSRHISSDRNGNSNYVYEAYYWENVPASCVCAAKTIYFGTSDGRICRFKNTSLMTDYSDGSHYDPVREMQVGGVAIQARYTTRNDDDDAPQYFKTMMKKGTMCTIAPFKTTSVDVYLKVNATPSSENILEGRQFDDETTIDYYKYYAGTYELRTGRAFTGPVSFEELVEEEGKAPKDRFFRKKLKKYVRLQLVLENKKINEGFGIFHIIKTYSMTRYAK